MVSKLRRTPIVAALLAAALLAPSFAAAQPAAADKEAARTLMDRGDTLFQAKSFAEALRAYESADQIMHVPTTGIEVAKTQVELGKLLAARDTALGVAALPERADDPAPFAQARTEAQELAAKLDARIPSLDIRVDGVEGNAMPRIEVDGQLVPPALFAVPRRVDPGSHVVAAVLVGYEDAQSVVVVAEGETAHVTLSMTAGLSSIQKKRSPLGLPVLALAGFGAGAASVALGTITGVVSLAQTSSVKSRCESNRCPASTEGEIHSARGFGAASDVFFGLGLAGAAVGVLGVLRIGSAPTPSKDEAGPKPSAALLVGPGSVGLQGVF